MIGPCETCPWKRSTKTADIPGGGMDQERTLLCAGGGKITMACHLTTDEKPAACAGWVVVVAQPAAWASGEQAIPMRLRLMLAGVPAADYHDGGHSLYPDLRAMLRAHARGVR